MKAAGLWAGPASTRQWQRSLAFPVLGYEQGSPNPDFLSGGQPFPCGAQKQGGDVLLLWAAGDCRQDSWVQELSGRDLELWPHGLFQLHQFLGSEFPQSLHPGLFAQAQSLPQPTQLLCLVQDPSSSAPHVEP